MERFVLKSRGFNKNPEPSKYGSGTETNRVHIGVVGLSFKTAPIFVREVFARSMSIDALTKVKEEKLSKEDEIVLLSTCNRIEIYFASRNVEQTSMNVAGLFELERFVVGRDFRTYDLTDANAISHLFNVAAGLDSLVVGESQILSQVRDAYKSSAESRLCGYYLSKLFTKAYNVGREIRSSHPGIAGRSKNSISSVVTQLISEFSETRYKSAKPNVLLVGSGKMIRLAINSVDRSKLGNLLVASRRSTPNDILAETVPLSNLASTIESRKIDIIVTATSSDSYLITPGDLMANTKQRNKAQPLLIIDISVPRNVDPFIAEDCEGVLLYNIDDLKNLLPEKDDEIGAILPRMRSTISEKTDEFLAWVDQRLAITPVLNSLRRGAEAIRTQELENALQRLPDITPEERRVIEKMTDRIIRRFLDTPSNNLKAAVKELDEISIANYTSVLSEVFSLDTESVDEASKPPVENPEKPIIQATKE